MILRAYRNRHIRQFVVFCLVGVINSLVDFSIYLGLTRITEMYYLYANVIAVLISMFVAFWLHKHVTFKNKSKKLVSQGVKFFVVGMVGFVLHNLLLWLFVSNLELYDVWAKIGAIIIVTFWNFGAQKLWAFAHK